MYKSLKSGFTLIEMLVVVAVIVLLIGAGISALWGSTGKARDEDRKNDLQQLQLAFRLYYEANGQYPPRCAGTAFGAGPGPIPASWGDRCDNDWIQGLVPDYLPELPRDPLFEGEDDLGFLYIADTRTSDGDGLLQNYKILLRGTAEDDLVTSNEHQFSRCANDCNTSSWPQCSLTDEVRQKSYAVYNEGYRCY